MEQSRSENCISAEEISIYLKVMKTVAFTVKKSETIGNVKSLFCEKEGSSANFRELCFNGDRLENHKRVVDYNIQEGSTLHLILQDSARVNLQVIIPSMQKSISIEAMTYSTIGTIKSIIQNTEKILPDLYNLFYAGRILGNDRLVGSLNLKSDSTLRLIFNPKEKLSIFVVTPTGETASLDVKLLYSVSDVKAIVGGLIESPIHNYDLLYEGNLLQDSKTLAAYNIKENSNLWLSTPTFQLFIKGVRVKTLALDVHRSDTIGEVKTKIFQKLRIPASDFSLCILFNGKRLEEARDLTYYNIIKDATLNTVFRRKA